MSIPQDGMSLSPEMLLRASGHAVYRCYSDHGELLYIGSTGNLSRRLGDHAQKVWFLRVRGITLEWYADELEARMAERRAIHVEHPQLNVVHKNGLAPVRQAPARRSRRKTSSKARADDAILIDRLRSRLAADAFITPTEATKICRVRFDRAKRLLEMARRPGPVSSPAPGTPARRKVRKPHSNPYPTEAERIAAIRAMPGFPGVKPTQVRDMLHVRYDTAKQLIGVAQSLNGHDPSVG